MTVCGDGEYIIYTSLAWRNKAFGTGTSFAWATDSNTYAVQEGKSRVRVYRNFKERAGLIKSTGGWAVEGVHGGTLLSARGNGFVMFWDWETGAVVRRIEVDATNVSGLFCEKHCAEHLRSLGRARERLLPSPAKTHSTSSASIVRLTLLASTLARSSATRASRRLSSSSLRFPSRTQRMFIKLVTDITTRVKTAKWIGDCLIYTNATNRLNYLIGDQVHTVNHFDQCVSFSSCVAR